METTNGTQSAEISRVVHEALERLGGVAQAEEHERKLE
jgi:hypothetical protein